MINKYPIHPKLEKALEIIGKEPNYEIFEYKGYTCIVKRMMQPLGFFGNLNGYVVIPKTHKFYGVGHDDIDIDCHGGLTWSSEAEQLDGFEDIARDDWIIGFDTAHYGDMSPFQLLIERYMIPSFDNTMIISDPQMSYKTFGYVKNVCKEIVDQLIDGKNLSGKDLDKNQSDSDN